MTREEFKVIVKAMRGVYPNCPVNSQQVFDLWYEMLRDMDYRVASANLRQHIQTSKFCPSVAELRGAADGKNFNNFSRRKYNMDELEQRLLAAEQRMLPGNVLVDEAEGEKHGRDRKALL